MASDKSFAFHTELRLVALTGVKATTLHELRTELQKTPGSSIFYHTHQQYLAHNFQKPTYYNDFAVWAHDAIREEALAEKLASIDILAFTSIRELRDALVTTVDGYIPEMKRPQFTCRPEEAFHFCRSKSFIVPTGLVAQDIPDFFEKLPHVTTASLYFHFFEARLRLRRRTNDFSRWLKDRGRPDLAVAIDRLDPYVRTLDELRLDILTLGMTEREPA